MKIGMYVWETMLLTATIYPEGSCYLIPCFSNATLWGSMKPRNIRKVELSSFCEIYGNGRGKVFLAVYFSKFKKPLLQCSIPCLIGRSSPPLRSLRKLY